VPPRGEPTSCSSCPPPAAHLQRKTTVLERWTAGRKPGGAEEEHGEERASSHLLP
jgi:hypothetical protein